MPWRPGAGGGAPSSFVDELYGDIEEDDLGAEPEQDELSDIEQEIFDPQMIGHLDDEYIAESDNNNAVELIEQMNVQLCEGSAEYLDEEYIAENENNNAAELIEQMNVQLFEGSAEYLDEEYLAENESNNPSELIEQMNVELCDGSTGEVEEEVVTPTSPIVIVVPASQDQNPTFTPTTRREVPSSGRRRRPRPVGDGRGARRGRGRGGTRTASLGRHVRNGGDPLVQVGIDDDDVPVDLRTAGDGGRGARRGRGRGGARTASLGRHIWNSGDPLVQVCVTEDDVPAGLRTMVEALSQSRQQQAQLQANRDLRRREQSARQMADAEEVEEEEDLFEDAQEFLGTRNSFEWYPMQDRTPQREEFLPQRTGSVDNHPDIYSAFRSFWDDGILNDIVTETNRYAGGINSPHFRTNWVDTNIHEILALFAFWMMLGIVKMPTIKACFSSNSLLKTDVFRKIFTSRRYTFLCRALHFANNDARPERSSRLYCLGNVVSHLNEKFKANYIPGPNISIDESLTLWKGSLIFRQYIKTKAARFGIKTFELCDAVTGYLWSFQLYTGRDSTVGQAMLLKSTAVVIDLIRPLLDRGYRVFMDNWFNSPTLARYLKGRKTDCVGTLRSSRRGVPPLLQLADLKRGQFLARHSGDMTIMAWQDKKRIMTISTCHGAETESVTTGRGSRTTDIFKPKLVLDYNKYMGGVDRKDQMLEPYLIERKRCVKWYMKMFKRLLNCSILNAKILLESSTGRHHDHMATRLQLVQEILARHLNLTPSQREQRIRSSLVESFGHWPVPISDKEVRPSDARSRTAVRLRCQHCYKSGRKTIRSAYQCERCQVPLCIAGCFKQFHANVAV